jgi:hypothetical protein
LASFVFHSSRTRFERSPLAILDQQWSSKNLAAELATGRGKFFFVYAPTKAHISKV